MYSSNHDTKCLNKPKQHTSSKVYNLLRGRSKINEKKGSEFYTPGAFNGIGSGEKSHKKNIDARSTE